LFQLRPLYVTLAALAKHLFAFMVISHAPGARMRTTHSALTLLLAATCLASSAFAWDPNAGAEDTGVTYQRPLPENIVPRRYYSPDLMVHNVPAPAPAPILLVQPHPAVIAIAPAPAPLTAQPQPIAPVEQTAVIAPPPAPAYYVQPAPAATPYIVPQQPSYTTPAGYRVNRYSIAAEGFWDRYREPVASLESNSGYGALDGSWTHYYDQRRFTTAELRGSYGKEHYSSPSGTSSGTDQWEYEARLLGGVDIPIHDGTHVKPYFGLDTRYYRDDGKGDVTDLGFNGYDRRIFQIAMPIGVTYDILTSSGYHFLPTVEAGPVIFGNVSTRLENIPSYYQVETQQHTGYELRGDFMMNNLNEQGRGFEFGPFLRYWHVANSNTGTTPPAGPHGDTAWVEPQNSRLQVGAKLGYLF
jgi:hypothetical protein